MTRESSKNGIVIIWFNGVARCAMVLQELQPQEEELEPKVWSSTLSGTISCQLLASQWLLRFSRRVGNER